MVTYLGSFAGGFANAFIKAQQAATYNQYMWELIAYYRAQRAQADHSGLGGAYARGAAGAGHARIGAGDGVKGSAPYGGKVDLTNANPDVVAYIRKSAEAHGVDPNTALYVASTEGLIGFDPNKPDKGGDEGSSFGPFQVHFGGISKANMSEGLGDDMLRQGYADPRQDWRAGVDFSMAHAAHYGWGAWHGVTGKLDQYAGISNPAATAVASADQPKAFIMHHTAGGGTAEDVVNFWKNQGKGYGTQYIMDRDGVVHDVAKEFGYHGTNEILDDKTRGLDNSNVIGMEIIAKDDNDVTDAQAKSAAKFIHDNYPRLPVYGHGQVNPGHKEATEGQKAVRAVSEDRGVDAGESTKDAPAALMSGHVYEDRPRAASKVDNVASDLDIELRRGIQDYRAMPTSKHIEDRRVYDPTSGGEVNLGFVGKDFDVDKQGRVKAHVSPEGKKWAAAHMPKKLPLTAIPDPDRPAFVDRSPPGSGEWRHNADGSWTHVPPATTSDRGGISRQFVGGPGEISSEVPTYEHGMTDPASIGAGYPIPPDTRTSTPLSAGVQAARRGEPSPPFDVPPNTPSRMVNMPPMPPGKSDLPSGGYGGGSPTQQETAGIPEFPSGGYGGGSPTQQETIRSPDRSTSSQGGGYPAPVTAAVKEKGKEKGKGKGKDYPLPPERPKDLGKEKEPVKAIPEPTDQRTYALSQPGQHQATGTARSPLNYDPFWRPNPPLNSIQARQNPQPNLKVQPDSTKTQSQLDIGKQFQAAAKSIGRAITGDKTPADTGTTTAAASGDKGPPLPPPRPPPSGDEGSKGPVVQTPDTPPLPTNLATQNPYEGVNTVGIPYQPQQVAQAQPIQIPRKQDDTTPDEGDDSVGPTMLASRKGGMIWKLQGGGGFGPIETGQGPPLMRGYTTPSSAGYTGQSPTDYLASVPGAPYTASQIAIGAGTDPNMDIMQMGQNRLADVAHLNPAQTAYYNQLNTDWTALTQPGNVMDAGTRALVNQMNTLQAPPNTPSAAPTPAVAPAPALPIVPKATPTVSNVANTAVNPASGDTPVGGTAVTGPAFTWAPGQTGTITPPKTGAGPATFGGDPSMTGYTGSNPYAADNTQSRSGSTYNIDPTDQTTYGGRRGGPVGYQDGGDVSPATLGMPPGLGGGGQQPIPPYYYNPATFAPMGAGIGRGFSRPQTSTYGSQGIPTYAGGGMVALQDGGDPGYSDAAYDDTGGALPVTDVSYGGGPSSSGTGHVMEARPPHIGMERMGGMGGLRMGMPRAPMGRGRSTDPSEFMDQFGNPTYTPEGERIPQPGEGRPQGAPNWAPQITDGDGNPSYGLTAAVSSFFHFIGNALGLGGPQVTGGASPTDPMVQANRRNQTNNVGSMDPQQAETIFNNVDYGTNSLDRSMKVIGGLEGGYKYLLSNGDDEGAMHYARALLMYLNATVAQYGGKAVDAIQKGDLQSGLDNLSSASENIPNGQYLDGKINPKTGNTVIVRQTDMKGNTLWQGELTADALLQIAGHVADGKAFYSELENMVGKYDPEYRQMLKDKKDAEQAQIENRAIAQIYHLDPRTGQPMRGGAQAAAPTPAQPMPGGGPKPQVTPAVATAPAPTPLTAGSQPQPTEGIPLVQPAPQPAAAVPSPSAEGSAQPHQPLPSDTSPIAPGAIQQASDQEPVETLATAPAAPTEQQEQASREAITRQITAKYKQGGQFVPDENYPGYPDLTGAGAQTANKLLKGYAAAVKEWETGKKQDMDKEISAAIQDASARGISQRQLQGEQFTHLRDIQHQDFQTRHAAWEERQKKSDAAEKQAEADYKTRVSGRTDKEVSSEYSATMSPSGVVTGKEIGEHLKAGLRAADDAAAKTLVPSDDDRDTLGEAMAETYRWNKDMTSHEVDRTVADIALGRIQGSPQRAGSVISAYGPERVPITITRNDGSQSTIVIPLTQLKNIGAVRGRLAATAETAKAKEKADKPIAAPPERGKPRAPAPPLPAGSGPMGIPPAVMEKFKQPPAPARGGRGFPIAPPSAPAAPFTRTLPRNQGIPTQ